MRSRYVEPSVIQMNFTDEGLKRLRNALTDGKHFEYEPLQGSELQRLPLLAVLNPGVPYSGSLVVKITDS